MLVSKFTLDETFKELEDSPILAVDTETSGLQLYKDDYLFAVIVATEQKEFYFNFNPHHNTDREFLLEQEVFWKLEKLFNTRQLLIFHNAKFDLTALAKKHVRINTHLWDTMVGARLCFNEHMRYSLAECAKRAGLEKSQAVDNYIKENRLYSYTQTGLKKKIKKIYYERVPLEIMQPYAETDARITYKLYEHQRVELAIMGKTANAKNIWDVVLNEMELIKTCFAMEERGIQINEAYTKEGLQKEIEEIEKARADFKSLTGHELVDSNKALADVFRTLGIESSGKTEKGNASYTDAVLRGVTHPVSGVILRYREHYKKSTFYQGLLDSADSSQVIHPNFKQSGTATGRFSCDSPNLQQIPKEDVGEHKIRGCFVPREGFYFVELDFQAMEYRLFADYANEKNLIEKINQGHDVHQATADIIGTDRATAKTINFLLLYGGGAGKLASSLGVPLEKAKELRQQYFAALPKINEFIKNCTNTAARRGWIFNWLGRWCRFPNPDFSYRACNYLIQGGTADVVKIAMNRCHALLRGKQSKMILQVHDSLLFEIHETELSLVPDIKTILESVWNSRIKLTTKVEYSKESWANLVEGTPQ